MNTPLFTCTFLILAATGFGQSVESRKLATPNLPASLEGLGGLQKDLTAYFAMDNAYTGGLTWSRTAMGITANRLVAEKSEGGRKYLDFSAPGACAILEPGYATTSRFTLCAWVQVPAPFRHSMILWDGDSGTQMAITTTGLAYFDRKTRLDVRWGREVAAIKPGWHHIAIVGDGRSTMAYLDAQPVGAVEGQPALNVKAVGNSKIRASMDTMMSAGVDEQYFFSRGLTTDEVATVMKFSKPSGKK